MIKFNVYPYHRVFYYKDVLNLNNIKDYIIVSYIDTQKYYIYKLKDKFYSLFKVVSQEDTHLVIIPCETNKNYMFTFNKYVDSELKAYEFENENNPVLMHKIHDSYNYEIKRKHYCSAYYEFTENTESLYLIDSYENYVKFIKNNSSLTIYRIFKIVPQENELISSVGVISKKDFSKHLYCCNFRSNLYIFDFDSQILLQKINLSCKFFIPLNDNLLICYNNNIRKGDVMIYNIETNSAVKTYKNILQDIYSCNSVIISNVKGKDYIYMRDEIDNVFYIKRFDLM